MDLYFEAATAIEESKTVPTTNMTPNNLKQINCGDSATVSQKTLLNNIDIKSPFFGGIYKIKKCKSSK